MKTKSIDKNKLRVRCRKIMNELINESFPVLKNKTIHLSFFFLHKKYSGTAFKPLPNLMFLFLNKDKVDKYSDKELTGLLAHELSHFETYYKMGFIKSILIGIVYWFNLRIRRREEVNNDKNVIKKGYAKNIYSLTLKRKPSKHTKYYFSAEDIKKYAKKIGKW
jgi:hypothetical protein